MVDFDDDVRRLARGTSERDPELEPNSGLVDLDAAMALVRARIEWEREEERRRREAFVALDARGAALRASLPSAARSGEGRALRPFVPVMGAVLLVASLGANAFAYVRVRAHERALEGALAERRAVTQPTSANGASSKASRLAAVEVAREARLPPERLPEPSVPAASRDSHLSSDSPGAPAATAREATRKPIARADGASVNRGAMAVNSAPPRSSVEKTALPVAAATRGSAHAARVSSGSCRSRCGHACRGRARVRLSRTYGPGAHAGRANARDEPRPEAASSRPWRDRVGAPSRARRGASVPRRRGRASCARGGLRPRWSRPPGRSAAPRPEDPVHRCRALPCSRRRVFGRGLPRAGHRSPLTPWGTRDPGRRANWAIGDPPRARRGDIRLPICLHVGGWALGTRLAMAEA